MMVVTKPEIACRRIPNRMPVAYEFLNVVREFAWGMTGSYYSVFDIGLVGGSLKRLKYVRYLEVGVHLLGRNLKKASF